MAANSGTGADHPLTRRLTPESRVYPEAAATHHRLRRPGSMRVVERLWRLMVRRHGEETETTLTSDEQKGSALFPYWGTDPEGTGICLSGGGIRSASYCLGALQTFERHGMLFGPGRAKYLSAVSGGSYIATALTSVARGQIGDDDPAVSPSRVGPSTGLPDMRTFAPGTPEERY